MLAFTPNVFAAEYIVMALRGANWLRASSSLTLREYCGCEALEGRAPFCPFFSFDFSSSDFLSCSFSAEAIVFFFVPPTFCRSEPEEGSI